MKKNFITLTDGCVACLVSAKSKASIFKCFDMFNV